MPTLRWSRPCFIRVLVGCAAALSPLASARAASSRAEEAIERLSWIASPYRDFRPPQPLLPGRAVLIDEASDQALRSALAAELRRLFDELYVKQGWRLPFAGGEPLRVFVARRESGAMRGIAARSVDGGRLVWPAVLLDATGLGTSQIVGEVCRQVARATLEGYGAPADGFLEAAAAEVLSGVPEGEARDEEAWTLAAALLLDFKSHPATLGRLWIDELVREAGGVGVLREAWERSAASGEAPRTVLLRLLSESSGETEDALLARCAARLYASLEPEASPSRLRLLDLETGALDAAAPAPLTVRHRVFLPESEETLRAAWPEDGSAGAAVVRYRDTALAPDVVFFKAGDVRAIPLSGVARIDWLAAGSAGGDRGVRAPVTCERTTSIPFGGLDAKAAAAFEGPRLTWTTASHDGLWGWAVFREEVLADGRIARTGPQIVPSSERSEESFRYVFLDSTAAPGTFYRYTVWAVTEEGLLARAFAATLKTAD